MTETISLKYINQRLQVGLSDIKHAYLLSPVLTPLMLEVYKGNLVYRAKGSTKRISYQQIKIGLVKKRVVVVERLPF